MEENKLETEISVSQKEEPILIDNSENENTEEVLSTSEQVDNSGEFSNQKEENPDKELILGKFKNIDDLKKAYEELQKRQGKSSEELGNLRKEIAGVNIFKDQMNLLNAKKEEFYETILRDKEKYSSPEYFQDPTFREIYKEALLVYGSELDTDRMVELIEKYVATRIQINEKKKQAEKETQNILDSMTYSKNPNSKFTPPKKSFDEMTPQEVDELLDRLI